MIPAQGAALPSPRGSTPILHEELRGGGVLVLRIDDRDERVNTLTPRFDAELGAALARASADAAVRALVIVSGKEGTFVVGAHVDFLRSLRLAGEAAAASRALAARLSQVAASDKPIVVAVHGAALGGGFELALAGRYLLATDAPATRLALPEVKLGLLPGANGLLRVAARSSVRLALDLGLSGRALSARAAHALGLVDEVCPPALLLDVACRRADELARGAAPRSSGVRASGLRAVEAAFGEGNPLGRAVLFRRARAQVRARTRGHLPAADRIVDVLERYAAKGFDKAAELEAASFGELAVSETSARLVELFIAQRALERDAGLSSEELSRSRPVARVGVMGAGLMGAGIACASVVSGLSVRVKDKDDLGVGRGLRYVRAILDERARDGRISAAERDALFARLTATTSLSGMRACDVVVEAVFEDLALKQAVLAEVEAVTSERCVFASNTASIPIGAIARAAARPENVVGMHYFSPVHKTSLLEVVRAEQSSSEAVATAVALGRRQGKTVLVVRDGVGFFTTRALAPYLNEAVHLLGAGVPIDVLDGAMIDWGFAVGPMETLDAAGIDVAAHVGRIMHEAFGDRFAPPAAFAALERDHRSGRRSGRGMYLYRGAGRRKRTVDTSVYDVVGVRPSSPLEVEEIQMRLGLQLVNEALRTLEDGVLQCARDGDVGAVLGLGFPAFRGGPFRYVDAVGATEIVRRIRSFEDRFGARWSPAPILVDMERSGRRCHP